METKDERHRDPVTQAPLSHPQKATTMELTAIDRVVMRSYRALTAGLAEFLGAGYEIVLHSLEDLDSSVIEIFNGHHSGRAVGAPITDLALNMLSEMKQSSVNKTHHTYFGVDRHGERLKSSTICIFGENSRVIGLLCINYYLSTPMYSILDNLTENPHSLVKTESFVDSAETLILETLGMIQQKVLEDNGIAFAHKNKEVVAELHTRGIFELKNAVPVVAQALKISKSTVYLHLRSVGGETGRGDETSAVTEAEPSEGSREPLDGRTRPIGQRQDPGER